MYKSKIIHQIIFPTFLNFQKYRINYILAVILLSIISSAILRSEQRRPLLPTVSLATTHRRHYLNTCLISEKNPVHGVDERDTLDVSSHLYTYLDKQLTCLILIFLFSLLKFRRCGKLGSRFRTSIWFHVLPNNSFV